MYLGSFWFLRMGLVKVWFAVLVLLVAMWVAFFYSGNANAANITLFAISYVLVGRFSYLVGSFRGMEIQENLSQRSDSGEFSTTTLVQEKAVHIAGKTHECLERAIQDFPSRYPEYKTRTPKLDDDVRPWLKSCGYARNDREAHVFGVILLEHFMSPADSQ